MVKWLGLFIITWSLLFKNWNRGPDNERKKKLKDKKVYEFVSILLEISQLLWFSMENC